MITVLSPGARTLPQDHGRSGHQHEGVSPSGPADPYAHTLANLLVGNPAEATALELVGSGPTLRFGGAAVIAYAGAEADLRLNDRPIPARHTVFLSPGDLLTVGPLHHGGYGYLAIGGGLRLPPVLGSAAACTLSGLGEALDTGQVLATGPVSRAAAFRASRWTGTVPRHAPLHYLPGPRPIPEPLRDEFEQTDWAVSPQSSRVGTRLSGSPLTALAASREAGTVPTMGMVPGAIQMPPAGQPIVLGPDHGTTGGYPVFGVVLPIDRARLAQTPPGARVRFRSVSVAEAQQIERSSGDALTRSVWDLTRVAG